MPHLALPTLTAYLRAHGVPVIQRDLNIEFFDRVLTAACLEQSIERTRQERRSHLSPEDEMFLSCGDEWIAQVEQAKKTVRSDAFFDGPASLQAFQVLTACLQIASLPFAPSALEWTRFVPPAPMDSSRSVLQWARHPQQNLFGEFLRQQVVGEIRREQPDLVGISVCTQDQMLAAMTLGYAIKQSGLDCHVTVGGPHITMLREQLPRVRSIWACFDSAIMFSGQRPLLRLIEALDGNGDLSDVPNLLYRSSDAVTVNSTLPPLPIGELPPPDFDGLPLDLYLSPRLILPLASTHRCYYGRTGKTQCAFCNQGYGGNEPFSQIEAERLVEQMIGLAGRYATRHIFFADEAITPPVLYHMSARLEALGSPIDWVTCARFEKQFTRPVLEQMVRGGCCMLLFGLESGSEKTIARIGKGTRISQVERILRDSATAGIWNHLFFFFGFPGEAMQEAQETVNLVYRHADHVHSASPGAFLLERYAPAHLSPRQYHIRQVANPPDKDLAIYFDYQVDAGLDEATAELIVSRLLDVLPEKTFGQYYMHDTYRFLYASHLARQGRPFPLWLDPNRMEETR